MLTKLSIPGTTKKFMMNTFFANRHNPSPQLIHPTPITPPFYHTPDPRTTLKYTVI
jgi:hypothetical protein